MLRFVPMLFGLVCLTLGSVGHVVAALVPAWEIRASAGWRETTCTIDHSAVIETTNSDGDTNHDAVFAYHHVEAGRRHDSTRVSFERMPPSGDEAFELVRRMPAGAQVACWVDPADPGSSVLSRSGFALGGGLLALGFQLMGLFLLGVDVSDRARRPRTVIRDGVLEVRPRWEQKLLTVAGAVLVAAQLAITSYALVGIDRPGAAAIYLASLALALLVGGHRLGQWLTGLRLTLTPTRLALGEQAQVRWRLRAPFGVGGGTIRLVGRETVWRGSGSDVKSEERVLHEAHVADLDRSHNDEPVTMSIPAGALPTLELARAHVDWTLEVHVELPRWPDLDLAVPIEVAAKAVAMTRPAPPRRSAPATEGAPRLVLDREQARYRPGETITGVIGWTSGSPDVVQVELRRSVEVVDGDPAVVEQVAVADAASLPRIGAPVGDGPFRGVAAAAEEGGPLAARDQRELRLAAPAGPVSYQSKLLVISWHLVLVVDGIDRDTQAIRIEAS